MVLGNGTSKKAQEQERLMEEKHKRDMHSRLQQSMQGKNTPREQEDQFQKEYLDKLTENKLDDTTTELLQNLLTPDYILSNVNQAEAEEVKWLARGHAETIIALHPPAESPVQGDYRKACYDDDGDALKALSDLQRSKLRQGVLDLFWRAKRSEGGWQQRETSRQYTVSEVQDNKDESRVGGLFS